MIMTYHNSNLVAIVIVIGLRDPLNIVLTYVSSSEE